MVGGAISIAAPCTLLMSPFFGNQTQSKGFQNSSRELFTSLIFIILSYWKNSCIFYSFLGEAESEGAGSANIHHVSLATILMITSVYLF